MSNETPLEKSNFSFVSSCQLEITSWLGDQCFCLLLLTGWNPVCLSPVHAAAVCELMYVSVLLCLIRQFPCNHPTPSSAYNLSASSSTQIDKPEGRGLKIVHLGLSASRSFIFCRLSSCGGCVSSHLLQEKSLMMVELCH